MKPQFPPECTRCGQLPAPFYDVNEDRQERHFCRTCSRIVARAYLARPQWWDLDRISGQAAARIEATRRLRDQHTNKINLFYPEETP